MSISASRRSLPASFKETSESLIQQDQKHQIQNASGFQSKEDERSTKKDPVLLVYGSKGSKIHYSGPLIVPSSNMDQMLKDHDRHIQEAFTRARIDKAKARKTQVEGNQMRAGSLFISGR